MPLTTIYFYALAAAALAGVFTWILSVILRNVSIVDSLWSLLFVLLAFSYAVGMAGPHAVSIESISPRECLVLALVTVWALRLSVYITWRNWGHGEDRRYQAIRARNEPCFAAKSLYLVFGVQVLLAWIISLPLLFSMADRSSLRTTDWVGAALWLIGFIFEAGGDWQLALFKSSPSNRGQVMDRGFWRYTRHPNYFGEFCIWWGFFIIAVGAGAWWSVIGPLVMSVLLLRVSGVTLLEKDIGERRPAYADYVRRTSAFLPWPPTRR